MVDGAHSGEHYPSIPLPGETHSGHVSYTLSSPRCSRQKELASTCFLPHLHSSRSAPLPVDPTCIWCSSSSSMFLGFSQNLWCYTDIICLRLSPTQDLWLLNEYLLNETVAKCSTCLCVKSLSSIWLCDPLVCSLPGSSVHGILQARILECVAIFYSRGSSCPRDWTCIFWTGRQGSSPLSHQGRPKCSSVQFSSITQLCLFATPCTAAHQASLSITNSRSLLKLMSIKSVMPSNHLILCHHLLLPPSIFPSIGVFSNESALPIRWPKYWSFTFSISPSNEYSGQISFRMDWLDLLAVQGILKSLLQHYSSKASILRHSVFFLVQLSHPYMTTGKTKALTRWTFVGKVMSLLFNMLSRLVIVFLPRSKRLLISWLQSPSAVIYDYIVLLPDRSSFKSLQRGCG